MSALTEATEMVCQLLSSQTYLELQKIETGLSEKGIQIGDDFILTEKRRTVMDSLRHQLQMQEAPTAIITGYFGSGKSAVLSLIVREIESGKLTYGATKINPLEIRLNEHNDLAKLLGVVLGGLADLQGQEWIQERYEQARRITGALPSPKGDGVEAVCEALVTVGDDQIEEVLHFLEVAFDEFRTEHKGEQVIGLIVDELENVSNLPDGRFRRLLNRLFDASVRHWIDERASRSPKAVVVFSAIDLRSLELAFDLRQDSVERARAVAHDVGLTRESAEELMKHMLRLYLTSVVHGYAERSSDQELAQWEARLRSAESADHEDFTYPVTRDVLHYFASRLLSFNEVTGEVRRFRDYQELVRYMLRDWQGGEIRLRHAIADASGLKVILEQLGERTQVNAVIDEDQVGQLIGAELPRLNLGQAFQLRQITIALLGTTWEDVATVTHARLKELWPETRVPSEKAFSELVQEVRAGRRETWSAAADELVFNIREIVDRLIQASAPPDRFGPLRDYLRQNVARRSGLKVPKALQAFLGHEKKKAYCDQHGVLHVECPAALLDEVLIGVGIERRLMEELVQKDSLPRLGLLMQEGITRSDDKELPVKLQVIAPSGINGGRYAEAVVGILAPGWENAILPVMKAIQQLDESLSEYEAFLEYLKAMALSYEAPEGAKGVLASHTPGIASSLVETLKLNQPDRNTLIASKLGFRRPHDIQAMRRLVMVLSSFRPGEDLRYDSSDNLPTVLMPKYNVNPLPSQQWRQELEQEWGDEDLFEDGRLKPFDRWAEGRRALYHLVNEHIGQSEVGFYKIAELSFGKGPIHDVDTAKAAFHLFLKLGRVAPLGWQLSDDQDEYHDLKVKSGALAQKQRFLEVQQFCDDYVRGYARQYLLATTEKRTKVRKSLEKLLAVREQLSENAEVTTLNAKEEEIREHEPPEQLPLVKFSTELLRMVPQEMTALGQYLALLQRIWDKRGYLARVLSEQADLFLESVQTDLDWERAFQELTSLCQSLDRECPVAADPQRLLVVVNDEFPTSSLHTRGQGFIEEFERQLEAKISNLNSRSLEAQLNGLSDWLDGQITHVTPPAWTKANRPGPVQEVKLQTQLVREEARQKMTTLGLQLKKAIDEAQGFRSQRQYRSKALEIDGAITQMTNAHRPLQEAHEAPTDRPLGQYLKNAEKALEQWEDTRLTVAEAVESGISLILREMGLADQEAQVRKFLQGRHTEKSLRELVESLHSDGIDLLAELQRGDTGNALALLGAAKVLNELAKEHR